MKSRTIAFLAAVVIAAAPAAVAQSASSKTSGEHHRVLKKHPPRVSGHARGREMQVRRSTTGYPEPFGYAPSGPKDYTYDASKHGGM